MDLKSRSRRRLAMIVAGAALLGGSGAAIAASGLHPSIAAAHATAITVIRPAPDRYNPVTAHTAAVAPVRIRIPSIGVDAAVEPVGVTPTLEMATPSQTSDAGWYRDGSVPGRLGDAVLDGHLDTQTGAPAVFAGLSRTQVGDPVSVLLADGTEARFAVTRVARVPYQTRPEGLFATDGPPRLTLITCSGPWNADLGVYAERLVVEASLSTN